MSNDAHSTEDQTAEGDFNPVRRDFLGLASATIGGMVLGVAGIGLITTFRPSEETKKGEVVERTLEGLEPGSQVEVQNLQGQLYYVRRRTADEIAISEAWTVEKMELAGTGPMGFKDIELDADRVQNPEYLVVEARCTHLGCAPVEQEVDLKLASNIDGEGREPGYFCPCHGSKYDISGRVRVGPAVLNLVVPDYIIETNDDDVPSKVIIGKAA